MPPTVHEVQATTGSSADVTVTAPATVQADDLLLAHVAFDGRDMPAVTSVPAGWSLIADDDDGNTVYGGWWYRIAQAGDASASWVFTGNGNSEEWIAHCVRVTGHHPGIPINAYAVSPHSGMSSGPWISPAVITTVDDCLIIYSLARDGGSHAHTPPPGCVEIFDGVSSASGGTAATKVQATAGDTGSGEFGSATSEQWIAITLAIAPEPSDDTLLPLPLTVGAPVLGTPNLSGPGMTPAPVFETDVEEAAPLDKWASSRNVTVTTAQAVSPTHSLLFAQTVVSAYVRQVIPGVSDKVVVRFHLRFDSLPTVSRYVWWYDTDAGQTVGIHYNAAGGHLEARLDLSGDYISVGPVVSAGQWYEIIIKVDISSTTHTLDWMVDGVAYATVERPGSTPDTFDSTYGMWFSSSQPPGVGNFYIDDVAVYNTLAAYPGHAADLNATDILLGAPTLDSPALSQNHALVGDGITAGAPTTGTPALSQAHALDGVDLAASAPTASAPALSQAHALAGDGIATAAPVVSAPAIGQSHALTADDAAALPPSLTAPALTQTHELVASSLTAAAPSLDSPAMGQAHALTATGTTAGSAALSAPTLGQRHELGAEGVLLGGPVLGTPSLSSVAALTANNLVLGAPVVEATVLTQTHELAGDDVATGPPELATAAVEQTHVLTAAGLTSGAPLPSNPDLDQVHVLVAMPLATAAPGPGRPLLMQTHELIAAGIVTGVPVPGRSRFRVPTAVCFSARIPGMAVSARTPRLTDVAARRPEVAFDVEEEICPRD